MSPTGGNWLSPAMTSVPSGMLPANRRRDEAVDLLVAELRMAYGA